MIKGANAVAMVIGLLFLAAGISSLAVAWIARDPNTKAGDFDETSRQ